MKSAFYIKNVECLKEPEFTEQMNFKMLSPLVLSKIKIENEKKTQYYLRYYDDINTINRVLTKNLQRKYELVTNKKLVNPNIKLEWDTDHIKQQIDRQKRLTRKISINVQDQRPIEVVGNVIPFTIHGNAELIKIGYECGFGEKNSIGMGMAEIR